MEFFPFAVFCLCDQTRCNYPNWILAQKISLIGILTIRKWIVAIEFGFPEPTRSKGVATAAVRLAIKNLFLETPIRKLIAYVHEENHPSRKVLEKIGFQNEGLLREHYLVNGEPVNECIYGLLKKDFIQ